MKLAAGLEEAIRKHTPADWAVYHRFEMETVFRHFLGEDYDESRIGRLMEVHQAWAERTVPPQADTATAQSLSDSINKAGQAFADGCHNIIGADDYARLFGAAPDVPVRIAVPEYENTFYANMMV